MKTFDELNNDNGATWKLIKEWVSLSDKKIELLPVENEVRKKILVDLQISTRSVLGSIIYNTGGLLVENGWLRILGAGNDINGRNFIQWNRISHDSEHSRIPGALLVADDVVGGFFAMNLGKFDGEHGEIYYLAPDTLDWECLDMKYPDLIDWAITGNTIDFYESFRWENWSKDLEGIEITSGLLIYPFLWAEGPDIDKRSKNVVPIDELWNLNIENRKSLKLE